MHKTKIIKAKSKLVINDDYFNKVEFSIKMTKFKIGKKYCSISALGLLLKTKNSLG